MLSFKDKTFCASPNCTNKCNRKMTDKESREYKIVNLPKNSNEKLGISYAYFCGIPNKDIMS
jgi:hypothetical protein